MKLSRIAAFARKETLEITRDPITVWIALAMPLIMLFLFGVALSFDVRNAPLLIVDHDRSAASRALADQFLNTGYFALVGAPTDERAAEHILMQGNARAILSIPPHFGRRMARGENAPVEFVIDGTYGATAAIVSAYGRAILYAYPRGSLDLPIEPEIRVWYNPELKSRNFIVPGLFAVILMALSPLLTALAVARERELGTIAQIYASPLTKIEFIFGKLSPYVAIAALQLAIVMAAGFLWFGIPMHGSLLLLAALGLLYVICTVSLGLLVSLIVRTQVAAMLVTVIITLMPAFLFSGFVYPIFTMPAFFQGYSARIPTMYFVNIARGIVMRGAGVSELWVNVAVLAGYTGVVLAASAFLFRKRLG
ncbi:MAG TPA: ABC transporter permease [Caulobacterales bacterium]|nr:ABC transporter permease [Caulobacterales bacterium]